MGAKLLRFRRFSAYIRNDCGHCLERRNSQSARCTCERLQGRNHLALRARTLGTEQPAWTRSLSHVARYKTQFSGARICLFGRRPKREIPAPENFVKSEEHTY